MNLCEISDLLADTGHENPKVRKAALIRLCPCHVRANRQEVWDRLIEMQKDGDPGVRSIVLHNLCDGSPRERKAEVIVAVERLADDKDRKLRRRAHNALAAYRRMGVINTERHDASNASQTPETGNGCRAQGGNGERATPGIRFPNRLERRTERR